MFWLCEKYYLCDVWILVRALISSRLVSMAGIPVGDFQFLKDIRYAAAIVKQFEVDAWHEIFDVQSLFYNEMFSVIWFTWYSSVFDQSFSHGIL